MPSHNAVREPEALVSAPVPPFKCHLLGLLTSVETLRNHQLCLAEWLRVYIGSENNGPEWFTGKPMLLYGYLEIDQLLTELIENTYDTDPQNVSTALLRKFIDDASLEGLDNQRELIRDSFLDFLPKQDDAGTNISIYDHGYAYTTLYEFINRCIYHLQDMDAEPGYLKGLTPDQKQIILGMKARGEDPREYTKLADSLRVGNALRSS